MANKLTSGGMVLNVGMNVDTRQAQQHFTTTMKYLQQKSQIRLSIDGTDFTKTIRTYTDQFGNLIETTTLWNHTASKSETYVSGLTSAMERFNQAEKQTTSTTNQLSNAQNKLNNNVKKSKTVFSDFADTFLKMAKFNTINIIYDGLTESLSNAVKVVREFNDATTELRKVSDLEGESLKQYAQNLADYGEEVGRTMTDMVNSATVFKRTGATDEQAKELAKVAEMYRNVADSEVSSAEASSFLVSQMKAFNITAENSMHIIDSVNSVANNFAVNTNDLQTALSKSASSMATAGNSYEETIALVEAGTAVMQNNAGTVGNGLRTIAINIANLATKSDEFVAANGKVKISLKDENGEIKNTYQVLEELSQNWDNLSRAEQNSIAVTMAGKHKLYPSSCPLKTYLTARSILQHYNYNIRMKYA